MMKNKDALKTGLPLCMDTWQIISVVVRTQDRRLIDFRRTLNNLPPRSSTFLRVESTRYNTGVPIQAAGMSDYGTGW
jgi:hypothetical protein